MVPPHNHRDNDDDADEIGLINNNEIRIRRIFMLFIDSCREIIESSFGNLKRRFRLFN